MKDKDTTFQTLKDTLAPLFKEREWGQFHTPKNLSMNLVAEAAELMELFLWSNTREQVDVELKENRQEVEDELADVVIAAITFAIATDIDIAKAIEHKIEIFKKKYPVELAKGTSTKYTKLHKKIVRLEFCP
ncbi:MAG: nucleotide pyrophosphohydrolase [Candidatus Babeliales bacterium]